jgi:hypothetical protein
VGASDDGGSFSNILLVLGTVCGFSLGGLSGYLFYLTLVALKPIIGSGYGQMGILVLFLFFLAAIGPISIKIAQKCCRE